MNSRAQELQLDVLQQFRIIYGSMRQYFRELEAVSYTHLDVYKRQASGALNGFSHRSAWDSQARTPPADPLVVQPAA